MRTLSLENWEHFESEIEKIQSLYVKTGLSEVPGHYLIYRGQSTSSWPLKTTLEREAPSIRNWKNYYRLCDRIKPQIEAFLQRKWDKFDSDQINSWTTGYDEMISHRIPPNYEFLIYLRHHGFPSPLLDWTRSPEIAAFFAFQRSLSTGKVAIYAFLERPHRAKSSSYSTPSIFLLQPYARAHARHFLQQSLYTHCSQYIDDEWHFIEHKHVLDLNNLDDDDEFKQDISWKFEIPISERNNILSMFDRYNLNSFSIFQDETSLLSSLFNREHVLR